jgi:membrane protease YdiL (CAAX protease family)
VVEHRYPWGPRRVLIAGFAAAGAFGFTSFIAILLIAGLVGTDASTVDVGDIFEKATTVAEYADARLAAATNGTELPEPPVILASPDALKIALASTLAFNAALFLITGIGSGLSFTELTRTLGLRRFDAGALWRPVVACFACYIGVVIYAQLISQLGIDFLVPSSTVPGGVLRDPQALAMTAALAVISAPFIEELFFRGFIFAGLSRWGFWPAAAISSFVFTMVHFDPGSIIPFFGIGIVMSYLFWSRGSLWDSIIFHLLFNGTSFLILVSRT